MTELLLGTAQFGDGYGITNTAGRLTDKAVSDILRAALDHDIRGFDTADGYGDAQLRLGRLMRPHARVTYISKFALGSEVSADAVYGKSLGRLGVDSLRGLLLHRVSDLEDDRFPEALGLIRDAQARGTISRFGVSVYDEQDLELAMRVMPDMGMVQIPGNVADQRLLDSKSVSRLHDDGVEVHVRSAFLQGLLLVGAGELPSGFEALAPLLRDLDEQAFERHSTRLAVVLGFLVSHPNSDCVVVGSTSVRELDQIASAWNEPELVRAPHSASTIPARILDPREW